MKLWVSERCHEAESRFWKPCPCAFYARMQALIHLHRSTPDRYNLFFLTQIDVCQIQYSQVHMRFTYVVDTDLYI